MIPGQRRPVARRRPVVPRVLSISTPLVVAMLLLSTVGPAVGGRAAVQPSPAGGVSGASDDPEASASPEEPDGTGGSEAPEPSPPAGEPSVAPAPATGSFSFDVRLCPPAYTSLPPQQPQIDGLANGAGTGLSPGDEAPLAGVVVRLRNDDTGEAYAFTLDGAGIASTGPLPAGPDTASFGRDGAVFERRSVCGSMDFGLTGSAEAGQILTAGEEIGCGVLTAAPTPYDPAAPNPDEIVVGLLACPVSGQSLPGIIGDGILDCDGDILTDEGEPYPGVTVVFTDVSTGDETTAETDAAGTTAAGTLPDGPCVVSLRLDGVPMEWTSMCGGLDSEGTPWARPGRSMTRPTPR